MSQRQLFNTRMMTSAKEMRKLRREREVERLRLQRKVRGPVNYPSQTETEFNLPDEARLWLLKFECPKCHWREPYMRTWVEQPDGKKRFQIYCGNNTTCGFEGPAMKSSQDAVQNWKLTTALLK